jgi:DNA replication factor GINS
MNYLINISTMNAVASSYSYYNSNNIESIQNAYRIGYLIEDVRVTYKRDIKIVVGNLMIDAKEGDISSIPRWVAKILVGQDVIEIQDNEISAYLSRALNRERIARPHDLSGIDLDFYIRVNDYLEGLRERERESLIISLNSFVASRLEKIVKLAASSPLLPEIEGKLSAEEKELYLLIHNSSSEFKKKVLKKFG